MTRYIQLCGLLTCLALCGGCGPAPPAQSPDQPTGAEAEAQMKAMEAVGQEQPAEAAPAEAAPAEAAPPAQ